MELNPRIGYDMVYQSPIYLSNITLETTWNTKSKLKEANT